MVDGASRTLRKDKELVEAGLIPPDQVEEIAKVAEQFSVAISPAMLNLIQKTEPEDPIAQQFVPSTAELVFLPEEQTDPIGDDAFTQEKGITHRYPDRLLLTPLHTCPVYCRFCFRREKVGRGGEALNQAELDRALAYIRSHPEVWEVILTGGDPLILPMHRLAYMINALNDIDHVDVIRIHTRVPVVAPERITQALVEACKVKTPVYVVLHCNHVTELGEDAQAACARLVDAGIPMLGQTVLLKGINDNPETMSQLMRALIRNRVKPYYLHHGDLAQGTGHFRTSIAEGQALMRSMRGHLSGICQPTYVLDIPGGYGKVPISPSYLTPQDSGSGYVVEDYQGGIHFYPPQKPSEPSDPSA